MGLLSDFKQFAMRGNVVDLAVGVIIGAAFNKIISALVDKVIMPPIGWIIGDMDFSSLALTLSPAHTDSSGKAIPAVAIGYGEFINSVVQFIIVAFVVFLLVKVMNRLAQAKEQTPTAPPPPSEEVVLLRAIRDALKK